MVNFVENTTKIEQPSLDELLMENSNKEAADIMSSNYIDVQDMGNETLLFFTE